MVLQGIPYYDNFNQNKFAKDLLSFGECVAGGMV